MSLIPTLTTRRLTLRAPALADFAPWAAFFASERSALERGPLPRDRAWQVWAGDVANWTLRGYGPFGVQDRITEAYMGEVGIYQPDSFPEPELGWFVVPEAEGQGIAAEAATAVLDWAAQDLGWQRLVSYIDPGNARSIALGLRLGGAIDPDVQGDDPEDVVIVHDLRGRATCQ